MLKVITLTATLALSATVAAQEAGNVKVACKSAQDTWGNGYCMGYFQSATSQLMMIARYLSADNCVKWTSISANMVRASFEANVPSQYPNDTYAADVTLQVFTDMLNCLEKKEVKEEI